MKELIEFIKYLFKSRRCKHEWQLKEIASKNDTIFVIHGLVECNKCGKIDYLEEYERKWEK